MSRSTATQWHSECKKQLKAFHLPANELQPAADTKAAPLAQPTGNLLSFNLWKGADSSDDKGKDIPSKPSREAQANILASAAVSEQKRTTAEALRRQPGEDASSRSTGKQKASDQTDIELANMQRDNQEFWQDDDIGLRTMTCGRFPAE